MSGDEFQFQQKGCLKISWKLQHKSKGGKVHTTGQIKKASKLRYEQQEKVPELTKLSKFSVSHDKKGKERKIKVTMF
jgi:hypothetical protein